MEGLSGVAERNFHRFERGMVIACAVPGRGNEEVEQRWLLPCASDEHVAAGAGPGQERLTDP